MTSLAEEDYGTKIEVPMNRIDNGVLELAQQEIHFLESGEGDNVLLFHGSGCDASEWKPLMEETTDYHFVAPDLSWYGKNSFTPEPNETRDFDLKIVNEFIDRYSPCHIVGHSYGGSLSLEALEKTHKGILSATLIEPLSFELIRSVDPKGYEEICTFVSELWERRSNHRGAKSFVAFWAYSLAWYLLTKEQKSYLEKRMEKITAEFSSTFSRPEDLSFSSPVSYPIYLIQGQWTKRSSASVMSVLERKFQTEAVIIPNAGHLSPITQARWVSHAILQNLLETQELISDHSFQQDAVVIAGS